MIKVSNLLANNIHPLIHGALMSRILSSNDNSFFAIVSSYQESEKVANREFDFESYTDLYVDTLNSISGTNWFISYNNYKDTYGDLNLPFRGKEKAIIIFQNDINIDRNSLFNKLYAKLFNDCPWIVEDSLNEDKKNFIRGFCELRGSIDTQRALLALDYFYDNSFELGKARLLNEYLSIPYYIININFRELQEQFVKGQNKRNTQLRLQLNWYVNNIGIINDYKTKIIDNAYYHTGISKRDNVNFIQMPEKTPRGSDLFIKRLMHFSTKIFGNDLTERSIQDLRNELGFDISDTVVSTFKRNKDIVELVRLYTPDECGSCRSMYNIKDRTFIHRRTNRPYFEIHHNVSLNNTVELDHEDNLVKLCPVCHSALKRGVAKENDQKNIIESILRNHPNLYDFAEHFFDLKGLNQVVDKIFLSLQ